MSKAKKEVEITQEDTTTETIPTPLDIGWTKYVISQLDESELQDNAPKTNGLRRVCEKLLGEIVETKSTVVQVPTPENLFRSTVEVTITIEKPDGKRLIYCDVGDACSKNCDPPYNQYPPAMAQTRALGRALRQALKLNVIAAEETSENAEYSAEVDDTAGPITDFQIRSLDKLCKQLNINLRAFVNMGDLEYSKIKNITKNKAQMMFKQLHKYQAKDGGNIPEKIAGYDDGWRTDFA
jgi:hypothetical protein